MIPRDAPVAVARFVEGLRAFGAHSIAASLGGYAQTQHSSLLTVGVLLAVYDVAEVIGKPVFGSLADRIGPRPILLGACWPLPPPRAGFVLAGDPALVGVARLGQGQPPPLGTGMTGLAVLLTAISVVVIGRNGILDTRSIGPDAGHAAAGGPSA